MPPRRRSILKDLSKQQKLVPHINRWFLQSKEGMPPINLDVPLYKEKDDAFHPSGDCTDCARVLYARREGHIESEKFGSGDYKTFANGHMWHNLLYYVVCEGLGFTTRRYIEQEYRLQAWADTYPGDAKLEIMEGPFPFDAAAEKHAGAAWWARGHMDMARVQIPGYDDPYLVDVKTMNYRHFSQELPPEPFWSKYLHQINVYLDWADLDTAILLAVKMDSGYEMKEIEIQRDPDLVNSVYRKWDRVTEAQRAGAPPEHDCLDPASCESKDIYVDDASASRRSRRTASRVGTA